MQLGRTQALKFRVFAAKFHKIINNLLPAKDMGLSYFTFTGVFGTGCFDVVMIIQATYEEPLATEKFELPKGLISGA